MFSFNYTIFSCAVLLIMFSKTAHASSNEVIASTPELVELMMSRTDLGPRVGSWVSINYFDEDKKCYEPRDRQALAPYVALARNVRGLDCILALYQYDSLRSGYISLPESEYAAFSRALKNKKIEFWLHEEAKWKLLLHTQLRQEMTLSELVSLILGCREWPFFPPLQGI